jgi:hypothetical protein
MRGKRGRRRWRRRRRGRKEKEMMRGEEGIVRLDEASSVDIDAHDVISASVAAKIISVDIMKIISYLSRVIIIWRLTQLCTDLFHDCLKRKICL